MKCNICNTESAEEMQLFDDRYGYKGMFSGYKCESCGQFFLETSFTSKQITELYTDYYPRSSLEVSSFKPYKEISRLNAWFSGDKRSAFRWVPENVRVLDIGCGFAQTLGYHKNRGCEVYGVEADENVRKIANAYDFNIDIGVFDAQKYNKDFFDYITMDQVIEHIEKPIDTLREIRSILKQNGKLIISTPNCNGWGAKIFKKKWINWHTPYHVNIFCPKSIKLAASESGFIVSKILTITSSEWIYYQFMHNICYPTQGQKSLFWSHRYEQISIFKKLLMGIAHVVYKLKVFHVITRLFDALGIGDNITVVLEKK